MESASTQSQSGGLPIKLGMEFDSEEHAYDYYNEYTAAIGFSVRKEYANKNRVQGYVTSRKLTCYKEGYRDKEKRDPAIQKHRKETRTGCLAHIIVSRQSNGRFRIISLEEEHNHPLVPSSLAHLLPSQRKMKATQAHEIDLLDDSGIRPKASFDYVARQVGGQSFLGYTKRDHKNYLRDKRKESLKHGVARSLVDYFEKRTLEDPAFRFSLQLDDDGLITNVFWADAKMIRDFKIYGLPSLQVPYPPSSIASMTTGVEEGNFPPWCPSHMSQGSSSGSLSQLLRDVSSQDFNRYSQC